MKDGGSEGEVVTSRLEMVEVGTDADGEPVTSCVVLPAVAVTMPERAAKLPKNQHTLFGILKEGGAAGETRGFPVRDPQPRHAEQRGIR